MLGVFWSASAGRFIMRAMVHAGYFLASRHLYPCLFAKAVRYFAFTFSQIVLVFLFLFFKWTIHYSLPAHSSEEIGLLFLQRIPPPPFKNKRDLFNFQLCMYVMVGGRKGTLKGRCLWRPEEPGPLKLVLLAITSWPRGCWDPNSGLVQ